MQVRSVIPSDLPDLLEIDGTIESPQYLHLDRSGEGLAMAWKLEERRLREKRIDPNRLGEEQRFTLKQIATGADEGIALLAEHEGDKVALLVAQFQPVRRTFQLVDLRVDYDCRRQGLATGMLYQVIAEARDRGLRAVEAETRTDNLPAARFLSRCGFDLAGLDAQRYSNHDLVKEAVALFWYVSLE